MVKIAFYKGKGKWFNRIIRWWTRGPYSHTETIIASVENRHLCYSANGDGVREAWRTLDPAEWDFVEVEADPFKVQDWFLKRLGAKYDYLGLLGFVFRPDNFSRSKYFCSETTAASLGIAEAWRFSPNSLKPVVDRLSINYKEI